MVSYLHEESARNDRRRASGWVQPLTVKTRPHRLLSTAKQTKKEIKTKQNQCFRFRTNNLNDWHAPIISPSCKMCWLKFLFYRFIALPGIYFIHFYFKGVFNSWHLGWIGVFIVRLWSSQGMSHCLLRFESFTRRWHQPEISARKKMGSQFLKQDLQ